MTITIVQQVNSASGATTTARTTSLPSTSLAGSDLFAAVDTGSVTVPSSITDTAGNTWVMLTDSSSAGSGSGRHISIWRCVKAAACTSVTFNTGSAAPNFGTIWELSGVGGVTWSNSGYNTGLQQNGGTSGDADAILAMIGWQNGNVSTTVNNPGNGDTYTDDFTGGAVGTVYASTAHVLGTTAGTRGPRWLTPGAVSYSVSAVSLYPLLNPPVRTPLPNLSAARAATY